MAKAKSGKHGAFGTKDRKPKEASLPQTTPPESSLLLVEGLTYSLPPEDPSERKTAQAKAEQGTLDYALMQHYSTGGDEVPGVPKIADVVLDYLIETDLGSITVTDLRKVLLTEEDTRKKAEFNPTARDWLATKVAQAAIELKILSGEIIPAKDFLLRYARLCNVLCANSNIALLYCEAIVGDGQVGVSDSTLAQEVVREIYG